MRRLRALGDAASTRVDAREALVRHSENVVKGGASLSPPRLGRYNRHVDPTRPRKRTERSIGASEKSDDDESHNANGAALGKTLGTTDEDGLSRLQLGGGDDAQTRRKTTRRRANQLLFQNARNEAHKSPIHTRRNVSTGVSPRVPSRARALRLGLASSFSFPSRRSRGGCRHLRRRRLPLLISRAHRGRDGPVGRERRRR